MLNYILAIFVWFVLPQIFVIARIEMKEGLLNFALKNRELFMNPNAEDNAKFVVSSCIIGGILWMISPELYFVCLVLNIFIKYLAVTFAFGEKDK